MTTVRALGVDHIVVLTADPERSLRFYVDQLGLAPVRVDEWRRDEVLFPSVRLNATTIIDLFPGTPDGKNVDHFWCGGGARRSGGGGGIGRLRRRGRTRGFVRSAGPRTGPLRA